MKAEILETSERTFKAVLRCDNGDRFAETIGFDTEQEAREALRKYFPAFAIDGAEVLPDAPTKPGFIETLDGIRKDYPDLDFDDY